MTNCFHFVAGERYPGQVCVRGASRKLIAELAAVHKIHMVLATGRTLSIQRYGERMTVRPAIQCKAYKDQVRGVGRNPKRVVPSL